MPLAHLLHRLRAIAAMVALGSCAVAAPRPTVEGPLSPEDERRTFTLPPDFEAELVAAESDGIGKFITVTWDAKMRLWTMTALEYPVDANENKAASDALFARGGRDKVLVFDDPYSATPAAGRRPRVFADGLVMPLGVQPYRDGALVQYGPDIRFYRDRDADGKSETHEVILTGFGTQDSHLFPHQFLRQPGGWMFVAQGAFNYSAVRRPGGRPFADGAAEVAFNQCKLARFQLDGSAWENVTAGPQNIWGLVSTRDGETFMQEANDMGYPVIPYTPGIHLWTSSRERLRPYQPLMPPPLNPPQMGGTGLSGLALAEDRDGFFRVPEAPASDRAKTFYLANPITRAIQRVRATPTGGRYRYEKLPDFLTTTDPWFRPVAVHFGPDGCLYIVDWYNKIISHNEIPRAHPDRDKSRGRIWRIRHKDQPRTTPPDLTKLEDRALLAHLGTDNALVARLAWLELIDRNAASLAPDLQAIASDRNARSDRRLGALWALEGLTRVETGLLQRLAAESDPNLRHEAARIAGAQPRDEAEFLRVVSPLVDDAHPNVRAAAGDALRRVANASPNVMALAARLGRASLPGLETRPWAAGRRSDKPTTTEDWEGYDREFERFLARWAMELNPAATRALLHSPEGAALPPENRALAMLALGGKDAALGLTRLLPVLKRPPVEAEVRALIEEANEPAVRNTLVLALEQPAARVAVLRAFLNLRTSIDASRFTAALVTATADMLERGSEREASLAAEVAGAFKLSGVEPALVATLERGWAAASAPAGARTLPANARAALGALREIGRGPLELLVQLARDAREVSVRDDAVAALAALKTQPAAERLVALFPHLSAPQRGRAIDRLAENRITASALLAGLRSGTVTQNDLGLRTLEKLRAIMPEHPDVAGLWRTIGSEAQRALRLNGGREDFVASQLSIAGPFTVECWVKLDRPANECDTLFGAPGRFALTFRGGRLTVEIEDRAIVAAKKITTPDVWTHYAVTRNAAGVFSLFINGELDVTSAVHATSGVSAFSELDIGRSKCSSGGTAAWLAEFRLWNTARPPREIRENFDRSLSLQSSAALVAVLGRANWQGALRGTAHVTAADDVPALLTAAEASAQAATFVRFRVLARAAGDPGQGKILFTGLCLTCHQVSGAGGQLAPPLDGLGHTGIESILRNVLTPNAAMESAYRTYRVVTKDDSVHEGFLAAATDDALVLKVPGAPDRRIPRSDVRRSEFSNRSLMPEGLLENLPDRQIVDLFAYLKTLQ